LSVARSLCSDYRYFQFGTGFFLRTNHLQVSYPAKTNAKNVTPKYMSESADAPRISNNARIMLKAIVSLSKVPFGALFLSGEKLEYSNLPAEHNGVLVTKVPMAPRPKTMFIMRTYTKKVRAVTIKGRAMIQAGSWLGVKEFGGS
jgi:hypothetical protein